MKKKTVKEVVLETIEYYENNPERRAVSEAGACYYYQPSTGKLCAVGRCMKDPTQDYEYGIDALLKNKDTIWPYDVHKEMKDEYSDITVDVWLDLQVFHDLQQNWDDKGLTVLGEKSKQNLINKYCQN